MLIDKTVQEIFMAHSLASAKAGELRQNFGNFPGDLITLSILALNKVWIKGLG
jgi:hypothetical protein